MKSIHTAAVIGSGVMGSGIAAHLANAGINCLLLDLVPTSLTPEEQKAGYTLEHSMVRDRLATYALERLKKASPAHLYSEAFISRIQPGNLEDHLERLSEVDWIIEVVVENLSVKQRLLSRIESVWKPGTIVSSNTSGISINEMVQSCGAEFKKHFLGTHFFNPPRYMKLLEVIPGQETDAEIVSFMKHFCEKTLGKGVVEAKDTPNFIANRIGVYGLMVTLHEMVQKGYTVEEIDAVTGPTVGRPKSATFRTLDLVGLDTMVHVSENVRAAVKSAEEKAVFEPPQLLKYMVARGWIGEKKGQGFYKRVKTSTGSVIQSLEVQSMDYVEGRKVSGASLDAAATAKGTKAKIRALLGTPDRYSELAWNLLKPVLLYSAELLGEIADTIVDIDNAMKWGFNWEYGPFEMWDIIGLSQSVQRMEQEGAVVPEWVKAWIAAGNECFYTDRQGVTYFATGNDFMAVEAKPEIISLKALKQQNRVVLSNEGANLIDIGDDVLCLEFTSPNNAIGNEILAMVQSSVEEVRRSYRGLVLANEGKNYSVGANLKLMLANVQNGDWNAVEEMIRQFQVSLMVLKGLAKPVVAAPHGMTLGGGVESALPADKVIFSPETYFGLVEVGVGLIPAGGGCKEMVLRASQCLSNPNADLQPLIQAAFETIAMAKVSTSGHDVKRLGMMREVDAVVINSDHRIYEAKQAVLAMERAGYTLPQPEKIRVIGENGKAALQMYAYTMKRGGYITEHDFLICGKLAHILAGGAVPEGTLVNEQYLLDLELEAFMSLLGEEKTQQRMQYMLAKGKALRN